MITRRNLATVSLLAAGLITVGATSAHAAAVGVSAGRTGVSASGSVSFISATRAEPVSFTVKDTACDGNDVYAYFLVRGPAGSFNTMTRRNSLGCGNSAAINSYINWTERITNVQLVACVDNAGSNSCNFGTTVDNPYT